VCGVDTTRASWVALWFLIRVVLLVVVGLPPGAAKPRYDQSTFYGRWRHFLDVTDPRCAHSCTRREVASDVCVWHAGLTARYRSTLLISESELNRALTMIQEYRTGQRDFPEEDLWRAKKSTPLPSRLLPVPFVTTLLLLLLYGSD
jgi:hypothetical protein